MTCDICKAPILPGESYSLSEHGRCHSRCIREQAPSRALRGERSHLSGWADDGPIFGLRLA